MTRHEPSGMNDLNREETSRYVDLNSCSYVIDVDMPKSPREPDFREMPETWKPIASKPFIDITRSTGFFGFLRAFYVPYFSVKANVMTTYTLYKQI
uniref:Mannosyltransferase n=1 Tax=Caenorhabditis tropicalis TaxID=1561998 RepID=A0A1I7UFZ9_9PELO